jgi:hypothetical protein
MEVRPVGAVIHAERQTAMTKLIGAFRDHAIASKDDSALLQKERKNRFINNVAPRVYRIVRSFSSTCMSDCKERSCTCLPDCKERSSTCLSDCKERSFTCPSDCKERSCTCLSGCIERSFTCLSDCKEHVHVSIGL